MDVDVWPGRTCLFLNVMGIMQIFILKKYRKFLWIIGYFLPRLFTVRICTCTRRTYLQGGRKLILYRGPEYIRKMIFCTKFHSKNPKKMGAYPPSGPTSSNPCISITLNIHNIFIEKCELHPHTILNMSHHNLNYIVLKYSK